MSFLHQPKRVYCSSDDAAGSADNTSDFTLRLQQPVTQAKSVRLASATYTSSVYNVGANAKFTYQEAFRNTTGFKAAAVRFEVPVPEGSYTGTTLAAQLTALSATNAEGVAVDVVKSDTFADIDFVAPATTLPATGSATRLLMYPIQNVALTQAQLLQHVDFNLQADSNGAAVQVGMWSQTGTDPFVNVVAPKSIHLEADGQNPGSRHRVSFLDVADAGRLLQPTATLYVGLFVTNYAGAGSWNAGQFVTSSLSNGKFVNRTAVANVADWEDNIAFADASDTVISASTALPSIRITTVPQLGYASNDSSDVRQRSQFTCAFDDTTQRFSFLPVTPTATWTTDYAALDYLPLLKRRHPSGYLYDSSDVAEQYFGFLEIPEVTTATGSLDRNSVNHVVGQGLNYTDAYAASVFAGTKASLAAATAAANTLTMRHIHRLVREPYVYLSCPDLVADTYSSQTTKPNRGILAKLPLHGNFGELLFYHALQGDSSSDSDVIRQDLQSLRFRVTDHNGNSVRLGGEISFVLTFQYE